MADKDDKGPDIGSLFSNMGQMQANIAKARDELEAETLQISKAGGAVTVVITGHQRVREIRIDPKRIDMDDVDNLQETLVDAVNQAVEMSQQMATQRMQEVMGGIDLPGMPGLEG